MTALKLADFKDAEQEYADVCAKLNRLTQRHAMVCEKNKKLAAIILELRAEIRRLQEASAETPAVSAKTTGGSD